jgi:hypothetical protein
MNKSLGTTVALGFAGMGAVVGTLIVIAWELTQRVAAAAVAVQTHARETRDVYAALALKAKDMRLHVVQVQQWLTDISATRAAPGFDEGFGDAQVGGRRPPPDGRDRRPGSLRRSLGQRRNGPAR